LPSAPPAAAKTLAKFPNNLVYWQVKKPFVVGHQQWLANDEQVIVVGNSSTS
jgi:hypothetical protein